MVMIEKKTTAEKKAEVMDLYYNPDSPLHCAECKQRLGFWRIFSKAMFKKPGASYSVRCPKCGFQNPHVKGEFKHGLTPR